MKGIQAVSLGAECKGRKDEISKHLWVLLSLLLAACGGEQSAETPVDCPAAADPPALHAFPGIDLIARVDPETLRFGADTGPLGRIVVAEAFPGLSFQRPVDFVPVPDGRHNVVVEHRGRVLIFENDADVSTARVFLDIRQRVRYDGSEQGLVRIAFDPGYRDNGHVYVSYAGRPEVDPEQCASLCSVVSRFTRSAWDPLQLDAATERIVFVLPQPGIWHNVGNLMFGLDGYLYVGVGDGGEWLDPQANAQNRTNFFGSVLRLDVSGGLPYRIPPDNPFVGAGLELPGVPGAGQPVREEIWAYGFRNPHRFSIDPVSGEFWLGDVGQAGREEIDIVEKGGNYGWPAFEGTVDQRRSDIGRDRAQYRMPVLEYGRSDGATVTAGYVYRGSAFPALFGRYLFADFVAGTIWSAERRAGPTLGEKEPIASAGGYSITALSALDEEPYFVNMSAGSVQKLAGDRCGSDQCRPVPERLSETGIFADLETLAPAPGLVPFEVIAPLWSDGTSKRRWLAVPAGTTIGFDETGAWRFPPGAVLVKHFAIDLDTRDACDAHRNLETRVLVHTHNGWIGYTYRWNEEQLDAELLSASRIETLTLRTPAGEKTQDYFYPSTSDCAICHNPSAGHVLGARAPQLNREAAYPSGAGNQLEAMSRIGLFDRAVQTPSALGRYLDPDDDRADMELRARSYLAANCAHCHNPGSAVPAAIDLRFETDTANMGAVGTPPTGSDMGVRGARIIQPGDRTRSTLWLRMGTPAEGRMPPLATQLVDEQALALIGAWIDAMQ